MAPGFDRARRAREVVGVARRRKLTRVLRELGVAGSRPPTPEGAAEFRRALEQLGTTFLKLGQLLSSRPDLLPDVYIDELSKLVDEVPPFPFADVERVVREDVGDAVVQLDPEPLAAASIAQIHAALLSDGREAVVKVRRPGIVEEVDLDLDLVRSSVQFLENRSETAQLLQLRALADELEVHLRAELDFVEEANNTELIAKQLVDYDHLVVPQVIRPHVTERLLVLERIHGRKLDAGHGLPPERASRARVRLLPRVHPPGHPGRRLPRRPAPGERPADRRRAAGAARLRPARTAGRRDPHGARAAAARAGPQPL